MTPIVHITNSGDVAWPSYEDKLFSIGNMIGRIAHDSAEGYAFEFAMNLMIMKYLQRVNGLNKKDELMVVDYLKQGKEVVQTHGGRLSQAG